METAPVKRGNAPQYILTMVVSFAATVVLTCYYLEWTGYPQLGGGELHIAHLLWGGLALFIASLLPLIFANRRAFDWAAVLSGVGVGLLLAITYRRWYLDIRAEMNKVSTAPNNQS